MNSYLGLDEKTPFYGIEDLQVLPRFSTCELRIEYHLGDPQRDIPSMTVNTEVIAPSQLGTNISEVQKYALIFFGKVHNIATRKMTLTINPDRPTLDLEQPWLAEGI